MALPSSGGLMSAAKQTYKDLKSKYGGLNRPLALVLINDKEFPPSKIHCLVDCVDVELTCGYEASAASLRIYNIYNVTTGLFDYSGIEKIIDLGNRIEIKLGYSGGALQLVFSGFIAGINIIYDEQTPYMEVTALDLKGAMMANNYAKQLKGENFGDCVKEILEQPCYGQLNKTLKIEATPDKKPGNSKPRISTIEMVEESDYEFVVKAAKKFAFEFFVSEATVMFRKPKSVTGPMFVLEAGGGLITVDMGFAINGLTQTVEARSADVGKAGLFASKVKLGGKYGVTSAAKKMLEKSQKIYIDPTIDSKEAAEQRAKALAEQMAYRFGSMTAELVGLPDLIPGRFITVKLIRGRESLQFYVVKVRHKLSADKGFTTEITAQNSSW